MKQTTKRTKAQVTPGDSPRTRKFIPVEESVHKRLRIMAAETGSTMSAIVERLISAEYHEHKRREHGNTQESER